MRLSYATSTVPPNSDPTTAAAYTQLAARRSPHPLTSLDLTLIHAPAVASGWSSFLGSIRTKTSLPPDIRELCICRVAALNGADFEWNNHSPILRADGGLSEEATEEVKSRKAWEGWEDTIGGSGKGEGEVGGQLNERQRAVLSYSDAMTVGVKVPDEVFAPLKKLFNDNEVVEITATVAAYNCVTRFLVALDVGEMDEKDKQ